MISASLSFFLWLVELRQEDKIAFTTSSHSLSLTCPHDLMNTYRRGHYVYMSVGGIIATVFVLSVSHSLAKARPTISCIHLVSLRQSCHNMCYLSWQAMELSYHMCFTVLRFYQHQKRENWLILSRSTGVNLSKPVIQTHQKRWGAHYKCEYNNNILHTIAAITMPLT